MEINFTIYVKDGHDIVDAAEIIDTVEKALIPDPRIKFWDYSTQNNETRCGIRNREGG